MGGRFGWVVCGWSVSGTVGVGFGWLVVDGWVPGESVDWYVGGWMAGWLGWLIG